MNRSGRFLIVLPLLLVADVTLAQQPHPAVTDTVVKGCERIIAEFENRLKGELSNAMEEGGPGFALGVCEITAPAVAARYSELAGWAIRRTAQRVRNPLNAPDSFEAAILEKMATDSIALHYTWLTDTSGQQSFRYLSAIYHGPRCVGCHGDPGKLSGSVKAALAELYPLDQAVGYEPGELRGAFSVAIEWPQGRRVADSLWRAAQAEADDQDAGD